MKKLLAIFLLFFPLIIFAQNEKDLIREGNKSYKEKKFNDAEIKYRKSLEQNKNNDKAKFNLGASLYKQKYYKEADSLYSILKNKDLDKETLAKTYHNLGNSLLQSQKYEESIEAYKNSLRLNPDDKDTKYNLEYARRFLQVQQQQQKQQQNKNDKNKQDDNKQQQQNQNQNEQQQKDKQQQQQQQQQQQKISKEDAKRILQALNNEEKNVQKKLKKKAAGIKVKSDKNW